MNDKASSEAAEMDADHGDVNPRFGTGRGGFVVAHQPAMVHEPTHRTRHDGQRHWRSVPPVVPASRTDRLFIFNGLITFSQRTVRRYDVQMKNKAKNASKARQSGAAEASCDARLALGRVTLALSDLSKTSGLSALAAKRQLTRLRGKVVRISTRQPFYLIISPEHRSLGAPPPNWWLQDDFDWLGQPY